MNFIYTECNFLTILERRDLYLLKYMYTKFKKGSFDKCLGIGNKPRPTLINITHEYVTFENCIDYRGIQLWNTLPKDWIMSNMSYNQFVVNVKEWIVKKRKNIYAYY